MLSDTDRERWACASTKERLRLWRGSERCTCGALVFPTERATWASFNCACGRTWATLNAATTRRIARALRWER